MKTTTKKITTSAALRQLRKLLPDGFKKIKVKQDWGHDDHLQWPGYTNGSLYINVRGVCEWRAKTTEKESCMATQIVISSTYHGVRPRYFRPRKNGTFNMDGVGTRLQAMVVQDAAKLAESVRLAAEVKAAKKADLKNRAGLTKMFDAFGWDPDILASYREGDHGGVQTSVDVRRGSVAISLRGITVDQVKAIMEFIA